METIRWLSTPRTQKRIDDILRARSRECYQPGLIEEPDPLDETISTRKWRYNMKMWIRALKTAHAAQRFNQPPPRHEVHLDEAARITSVRIEIHRCL